MKKILSNGLLPFLILGMTTCGIYTAISSYSDEHVDFTKYKTFAWLPDSGMTARTDSFRNSAYDNDVIRNNAKNYIVHDLGERGLIIKTDEPDVLMQLIVRNEKKELVNYAPYYFHNRFYYPYYYPYYDYYTYYGWGCMSTYCDYNPEIKQTYVQGTITINMFDRRQKKLVWYGSAEGDIYDPSYIQHDVHPAIHRIMKSFPVKQRSFRK